MFVIGCALASGCAPDQDGAAVSVPAAPVVEAAPGTAPAVEAAPMVEAAPGTAPAGEAAPAGETAPATAPAPAPVVVDLATVTAIRAKIVAIPNRKNWTPCGYNHSVGMLEVEVLDAGEPPPRVLLFVSCPVDGHTRPNLVVGATISVTLHQRRQPWPWPSVPGVSKDLPRRQVKSFVEGPAGLGGGESRSAGHDDIEGQAASPQSAG